MRNQFDKDLAVLHTQLIEMGGLIEDAIDQAVGALMKKDESLAAAAIEFEDAINKKEHEIESLCLRLLLQQQPVASDLRLISAALKMITDMERIGDQASDIAEITIRLMNSGESKNIKKIDHIEEMSSETITMVRDAIDAYVARDVEQARNVIACDDKVDSLFEQVRDELISLIRNDSISGELVIDLLMVAKYFERIGDHAVNIAQWVIFSITGGYK